MNDVPASTRSLIHENPAPETQAPTGRPGSYAKYRIVHIRAAHGCAGYYVLKELEGGVLSSVAPPWPALDEAILAMNGENALARREANDERD